VDLQVTCYSDCWIGSDKSVSVRINVKRAVKDRAATKPSVPSTSEEEDVEEVGEEESKKGETEDGSERSDEEGSVAEDEYDSEESGELVTASDEEE